MEPNSQCQNKNMDWAKILVRFVMTKNLFFSPFLAQRNKRRLLQKLSPSSTGFCSQLEIVMNLPNFRAPDHLRVKVHFVARVHRGSSDSIQLMIDQLELNESCFLELQTMRKNNKHNQSGQEQAEKMRKKYTTFSIPIYLFEFEWLEKKADDSRYF